MPLAIVVKLSMFAGDLAMPTQPFIEEITVLTLKSKKETAS